jgi:hypothetical protein
MDWLIADDQRGTLRDVSATLLLRLSAAHCRDNRSISARPKY